VNIPLAPGEPPPISPEHEGFQMSRIDQALTRIAAIDPKWLLERKAAIERRQREHNERLKDALPGPPRSHASRPDLFQRQK